jgi:hypothetical protein
MILKSMYHMLNIVLALFADAFADQKSLHLSFVIVFPVASVPCVEQAVFRNDKEV